MQFIILVKSVKKLEDGHKVNSKLVEEMDLFNDELEKAGARVMAKGLYSSSKGLTVQHLNHNKKVVTKGSIDDQKEIIGFFLINAESFEEAEKWALKVPDPLGNGQAEIELRQLH